jgi:ERF superfamily protein
MKRSEMINEISKAMANAQGEMEPALKSSKNPFFKSNYADLAAIMESIKIPLKKNDLSIWQDVITNEKGISVCTMVSHSSGQWIEFGPLEIALAKRDAQSVGSAITYAKRYALSAAVGVVSDNDDDGEAAMGRNAKHDAKTVQFKVDTKMVQQKPMEHMYESLEMVGNKKIDKSQWTELNKLIDQCDASFQTKVWDRLASMGIQSMEHLDEETFVKMRDAALGNIAKKGKQVANEAA